MKLGFDENKLAKENIQTIRLWLEIMYAEQIKDDIHFHNLVMFATHNVEACKVPHIKNYRRHNERQAKEWAQRQKK